jgi:hypothetical protein
VLTTKSRNKRIDRDIFGVRLLLQQLIVQSEVPSEEATEFNNFLDQEADLLAIESAFAQITDPDKLDDIERQLEHLHARITEEGFVEGETYAAALSDEVEEHLIHPLLRRILDKGSYKEKHYHFVSFLWSQLEPHQKDDLLAQLSDAFDAELPSGNWAPYIRILKPLGSDAWNGLRKASRIRLESLICNDILAGRKDIFSYKEVNGGALGTYALSFWPVFDAPEKLARNLIALLNQNWYTQNYVGAFFVRTIPKLANKTSMEDEFIDALKVACRNDARLIKTKIGQFPVEWQEQIRDEA